MRVALAACLGLVLVVGLLAAPGGAAKKKKGKKDGPDIDPIAIATYDSGTVTFSVRVERAKQVHVTFRGSTRRAPDVENLSSWYAASFGSAPDRPCYSIRVRARGKKKAGVRERDRGACRPFGG
jgi:hypothetical protein